MDHQFRSENKHKDERSGAYAVKGKEGLVCVIEPHDQYPYTWFNIKSGEKIVAREKLSYSHHGLGKFLSEHDGKDVLDLGCGDGVASRLVKSCGLEVFGVEVDPKFTATYAGDVFEIEFGRQFGAIWCSHILEHQRNVGNFLRRIFDLLCEGGLVAITVPSALYPMILGHPFIFTPLHVIYNLVLAGFDCKYASVRQYDWQLSVVVRKKDNGIKPLSYAATPLSSSEGTAGFVPQLREYFPIGHQEFGDMVWGDVEAINW